NASGQVNGSRAIGKVPIGLAGMSSATVTANPPIVYAGDAADHRTTITVTNIRDAAGVLVPDGAYVGVIAANCATKFADGTCVTSAGGSIVGGTVATNFPSFKVFQISNGQLVFQYSVQGLANP